MGGVLLTEIQSCISKTQIRKIILQICTDIFSPFYIITVGFVGAPMTEARISTSVPRSSML